METLEPGINETPAANEPARKRDRWQGDWIRDQANVVEVESKNGPIVCNKCGRAECREVPPVERYVLSYIRAHVRVTKVLREVVICRQGCEFFRAPWPESVEAPLIERGAASPSMVAAVMTDHAKYGIPVFTQQQILAEVGVQIPYGALLRYRGQGTDLLRPLYKLMDKLSQTEARILIDDTRYLALRLDASENEKKTINGRMWGKTDNKTFAYFAFAENWKATFLETFLGKFIGVLVGDGYAGYAPYVEKNGLKGLAGCNDHARRKFNESALLHDAKANEVLTIFKTIYHVENEATVNTWCREEIRQNRQELSKPAFEKVRSMLIEAQHSYPAGSTMARAITYFLRNYDRLTYYLDDGDIPISTAALERMIRSIAKIRKNSMFVGSVASGEDLAINLSFMKSCELAGICYFKYLVDVLPKLSGTTFPAQRAEELLPHRWAEIRGLGRYKPVPAAA